MGRCASWRMHLHELVVQDGGGVRAGGVEECLKALPRPIVHAVRAQHIQLLQPEVLLYTPQRLYLSPLPTQSMPSTYIVLAGSAQHIQLLRPETLLHTPQRLYLNQEPYHRVVKLQPDDISLSLMTRCPM